MAVAAALAAGIQIPAQGAGLGELTVQSALGQPLVAEVQITSLSADALKSLSAKLAPVEAFRQAGLEFRPALSSLRFVIDRQPDGRAFVRITSTQPVNEPFVDLLVELNWAAGRFVREYTFLLDPPGLRVGRERVEGGAAGSRMALPAVNDARIASVTGLVPISSAARVLPSAYAALAMDATGSDAARSGANGSRTLSDAVPDILAPVNGAANVSGNAGSNAGGDAAGGNAASTGVVASDQGASRTVTVQRGEALAAIATRSAPDVPLEQAIVAIYRANPQAFFGNVHQMYAGSTLTIPDRAAMQAIDVGAARREIQDQTAAFNAHRELLAADALKLDVPAAGASGVGAVSDAPEQSSTGDARRDRLRLSPAATAVVAPVADKAGTGSSGRAVESSGSAPALPGGGSTTSQATETRVAEAAALREQATRVEALEKNVADLQSLLQLKSRQLAGLQQQVDAAAPGSTSAATASTSAAMDAPRSVNARPGAGSTVPVTRRERSFVDDLLASPLTVPGLAAILVALGAYGWYTLRRRKSEHFEDSLIAADEFTANSLFGTTGGQAVDTSDEALFGGGLRNAAADVHATEVDPIAEAEVYIAYGRESQAEDILREALERQPERQAIRLKLLEMYAARRDAAAFGRLAHEMYDMTGGRNEEWPKAATLGLSVDPGNALYVGGDLPPSAMPPSPGRDIVGVDALSGFGMPRNDMEPFDTSAPMPDESESLEPPAIDFSLDLDIPREQPRVDLPDELAMADHRSELERVVEGRFDLPLLSFGLEPAAETEIGNLPASPDAATFSGLPIQPERGSAEGAPAERTIDAKADDGRSRAFLDMGDFRIDLPALEDLDLDSVRHGAPFESGSDELALTGLDLVPAEDNEMHWQEMATKLDLASAYEEIGDKDGARELLEEVLRAGDTGQRHTAGAMLSKIG